MDFQTIPLLLFSISCTCFLVVLNSYFRDRKLGKLPPGPYALPIIGNIHELGSQPHQSLAKLSKTYGPLMSLRLGSKTTIVASSPEMAKAILQKNDLASSSRTIASAVTALNHATVSVAWMPANAQWRKLRKICKEQMFSVSKMDISCGLRREKLKKLCNYVEECCQTGRSVDIGEAAFTTSLNLMSSTLFSKEVVDFNSSSTQEMKEVLWGAMRCIGSPNLSDYFLVLKPFDFQGFVKETKFYFEKLLAIFDEIIDERLKSRAKGKKHEGNDMVEALLDLNQKNEPELSRKDIDTLILDLILAGTETASATVEWAIAELLRSPDKMSRVRNELRDVVGENEQIQESDISNLPYLQAVVKETFRLHPAAPFLVPHKAENDIEINGYVIPKNAQILVNIWASGRDSNVWSNADSFMPERFLDGSKVDFRGQDFELIPFGAGRRICPGLPLAHRMVHLMVATFVHKFDWKLEDIAPHEIDMTEQFGLTLQKAIPLRAIPVQL